MTRSLIRVGAVLCVLLASVSAPAAASEHAGEEFLVQIDAGGDADVAVTYAYDLETDSARTAFEELRTNETARERLVARFHGRMGAVADEAGAATGREMTVTDANVEVDAAGEVGLVTLTVEWTNLAAVEGDRLIVTEPFASGFESNRPFTVETPDGYELASAEPAPSSSDEASATWAAGTSLEGFELIAEPAAANDDGSANDGGVDGDGAGPGIAVAVAALIGVALAVRRRA